MNYDLSASTAEPGSGKPAYGSADSAAGILALAFGYLFVRWILWTSPSAGGFVFTFLLISGSAAYLRIKKIPLSKGSAAFILITFVFSLGLIISANAFIRGLVMIYVVFSSLHWFCFTCADAGKNEPFIDDMVVFNIIKAVIVMPLSCFGKLFGALSGNIKKTGSLKKILMIAGGLFIAAVPTLTVTFLLVNADDVFRKVAENLLAAAALPENFQREASAFVLGIPVSMYIFGTVYSNSERKNAALMTREKNESFIKSLRFTPGLVVYAAVTPICLVYAAFFLSQTAYFLSAFSNIIPEGYTYAEYARKGFFELCSVAVINVCVIIFISVFTKRDEKKPPAMKFYITLISIFTLMMIAVAVSKMAMYIRAYGLTPMRVFPTWFMILLALVFTFIIIRQYIPDFKLFPYIFTAFVIMFGLLVFIDIDRIIADYNINRYLEGSLRDPDINMIKYQLSDSALPALAKLRGDAVYGAEISEFLSERCSSAAGSLKFPNFNISSWSAVNKIK